MESKYPNVEPRKFFATIKNEVNRLNLRETLANKTRAEIKLYAANLELDSSLRSKVDMRIRLQASLISLGILLLLIVGLVILTLMEQQILAIIMAVLILVFLIFSSIGRTTRKSFEEKIARENILRKIESGEINIEDKEVEARINDAENELKSLQEEISRVAEDSQYFKLLDEKYRSLYTVNRLHEISKSNRPENIEEALELYDIEDEAAREEQERQEQEHLDRLNKFR